MTTHTFSDLSAPQVKVWDIGVRLFHWSMVASVSAAYLLTDPRVVHRWLGYTVAGLIAFRLIWGLVGPRYARFRSFLPTPRHLMTYLRDMISGREARYLGHNPAGAAMIVALLLTLTGTCTTGVMMGMDRFFGQDWVEHWHAACVDGLLILVFLHVAGVVFSSLRHRENLVVSMITGQKAQDEPHS